MQLQNMEPINIAINAFVVRDLPFIYIHIKGYMVIKNKKKIVKLIIGYFCHGKQKKNRLIGNKLTTVIGY